MKKLSLCISVALLWLLLPAAQAGAQSSCERVVIFTLPGITWERVQAVRPPNILDAVERGATGAISVRTNSSRTSVASGYVTIGAGTRADGGRTTGGTVDEDSGSLLRPDVEAAGLSELRTVAETADYRAVPGALATAMAPTPLIPIGNGDPGLDPPSPLGHGRWPLLAAMRTDGSAPYAAVGSELLEEDPGSPFGVSSDEEALRDAVGAALDIDCSSLVIGHGDLIRADRWGVTVGEDPGPVLDSALLAADALLGHVVERLDADKDLLLVVSPTSPFWDQDVHLGVAVAVGPGFPEGTRLRSASTRKAPLVTLPDVAPTVLAHLDIPRPPSMLGRPWTATGSHRGDAVAAMVDLDRESVFAHATQADVATSFVLFQIVVYVLALLALMRNGRPRLVASSRLIAMIEHSVLAIVAFPLATYLASPIPAHRLGTAGYFAALILIDVALVSACWRLLDQRLDRLLAITAATLTLFMVDLSLGGPLQLNAVFGNDPIVAGRFSGLGNIAYAVLGTSSLMTGALLVHRWPGRRSIYVLVAFLFVATVIFDGAPNLGSDVGGVISLVPVLAITYALLLGKRPGVKVVLGAVVAMVMAVGLFLAWDLARPPGSRTHLARLFEDVRGRGGDAFFEAIERKVRTNLRVFRRTIWTYLVPPSLGVIAYLLLRPTGRWQSLARTYPKLRAGLIGGLLLSVVGFAVNDSGIVVPAMVLSFLVPLTVLLHLKLETEDPPPMPA
ncbi:MAG: hypothetical protein ACR2KQ_10460 [Actinomycetota bacterium]